MTGQLPHKFDSFGARDVCLAQTKSPKLTVEKKGARSRGNAAAESTPHGPLPVDSIRAHNAHRTWVVLSISCCEIYEDLRSKFSRYNAGLNTREEHHAERREGKDRGLRNVGLIL